MNLLSKGNGEFDFIPGNSTYERPRTLLQEAFTYRDKNYYVGIGCPCCVGEENFHRMKRLSGQDEEHLTWANIFVNANYRHFIGSMIPEIKKYPVILASHEASVLTDLPFKLDNHYRVPPNAWLSEDITNRIQEDMAGKTGYIVLFASGPHANIATYMLHKSNPGNTYIDAGSVFDAMLGLKVTRRYLKGLSTVDKICIWS